MNKYALYPGCIMPTEQYAYELSLREICKTLHIDLIDLPGFSCCGEPTKNINKTMTLYLSARNIAIAEHHHLPILSPCPMCHYALTETQHILTHNTELHQRIQNMLTQEQLTYHGTTPILHTIELLHDTIGLNTIKQHIKKPLTGLKLATHYGCHLIRPKELGRPDDSENPQKIENILTTLGATPHYYPEKLDCCGAPLLTNLPESALTKTGQKLQRIQEQKINALIDTCPWCHKMFDAKQQKAGETVATKIELPVLYLTQIIGIAFDIDKEKLGLHLNQSPIEKIIHTKKKEHTHGE